MKLRFAPSPTGPIHVGNIRTAIFNYLYAKHHGGEFMLRMEDTDLERSTAEAKLRIITSLKWLGLNWTGDIVHQSERTERYKEIVDDLLERGIAYKSDKAAGEGSATGEAIWFKVPRESVEYDDLVLGKQKQPRKQVQDFVIVRSSGQPMFILANAIDDMDMGITHVLRGVDHKTNAFRQVLLYDALGAEPPRFGHLPLIVDKSGKPLSKRDDNTVFIEEFIELGYLPETMVNFLSLLGWSPKPVERDGKTIFTEKMSRDDLIAQFDLDRVKKSPAQFDIVKLGAMNYRYILNRLEDNPGEMINVLKDGVAGEGLDPEQYSDDQYMTLIDETGSRSRTLRDLVDNNKYFFTDTVKIQDDKKTRRILSKENVWSVITLAHAALESIDEWHRDVIYNTLCIVAEKNNLKIGDVAQPVRVLVTGSAASPPINITLELIGKERTLERLKYPNGEGKWVKDLHAQ